MEESKLGNEYPSPYESDYDNWHEYRFGTSKHRDYDDEDWQLVYFAHFAESQTSKLRKFLKFRPEEKKELSAKVKFNLFLMDLQDKLSAKAMLSLLIIGGIFFYAEESGTDISAPSGIKITFAICWTLAVFVILIQRKLPYTFYPYMMGNRSHLFADCSECQCNGVTNSATCRDCNGLGMLIYYNDPHFAFKENGAPNLDELSQ